MYLDYVWNISVILKSPKLNLNYIFPSRRVPCHIFSGNNVFYLMEYTNHRLISNNLGLMEIKF